MEHFLTEKQKEFRKKIKAFAEREIIPIADENDENEELPAALIEKISMEGLYSAVISSEFSGLELDFVSYGLLCEEIGKASASVLSMLIVHNMAAASIEKWGSLKQKKFYLPGFASGEIKGGFALTEPDIGSDAKNIKTTAVEKGEHYVLNGSKKWISGGQTADVFLVIARVENLPTAFIIDKDTSGFSREPMKGLLGFRSAMLAELNFEDCLVKKENIVGRIGFGFSHVAASALDIGRNSVGWGCVGLSQGCFESCLDYSEKRNQFGTPLKDHQLIQKKLTDMIVNIQAARLLCYNSGFLKECGDPTQIMASSIAKYFSSRAAMKIAEDAVQIHGASGCSGLFPVQRYFRDAKIMEIIEGSTQIMQTSIAKYGNYYCQ